MPKVSGIIRAARLLRMAKEVGLDVHNFKSAFTTGRFTIGTEYAILKYFRAETIGDAHRWLSISYNQWFQDGELSELEAKGWLPKTAQKQALSILRRADIQRWCSR